MKCAGQFVLPPLEVPRPLDDNGLLVVDSRYVRLPPADHLRALGLNSIGLSNQQGADRLGISLRTFGAWLEACQASLGCRTVAEACRIAVENGVLPMPRLREPIELPPRRKEIALLDTRGLSDNTAIAAHIGIRLNTVKAHKKLIFNQLHIRSHKQLGAAAFACGVLPPAPVDEAKQRRHRLKVFGATRSYLHMAYGPNSNRLTDDRLTQAVESVIVPTIARWSRQRNMSDDMALSVRKYITGTEVSELAGYFGASEKQLRARIRQAARFLANDVAVEQLVHLGN